MADQLQPWRRTLCGLLVPIYLMLIFGVPSAIITALLLLFGRSLATIAIAGFAPLIFTFAFCLTAGCLSLAHRKGVVAGKFPRDITHPTYFHRRLYGLCWTSLYYCKPVYYLCLTIPALKKMTFRLFGYMGQMDFTVYPDTWIRDLPLLEFGKGAYIANKATLGTNLALPSGDIMVGKISIGASSLVGHLTAIACGTSLGSNSEIGACAAIGYKTDIGSNVKIEGMTTIEHGVLIADGCAVGTCCYVGSASRLSVNTVMRPGTNVAPRTRL